AGCVVPPKANLGNLKEQLQNTVRVKTKNSLVLQMRVGTEEMSIEDVSENIQLLYDSIVHHLPKEENNVDSAYVKKTMSKAVKIQ
ncbi:MAG: 50S ribosomal protein L1, partial [Candidatus Woesearchaeota archaeon]